MFDLGWSELLVIGVVALIVVGPKDLPVMFRTLGRYTARLRGMAREFTRAMEEAADESGMRELSRDLRTISNPRRAGTNALKKAANFDLDDPFGEDEAAADKAEAATEPKPRGPETQKLAQSRADAVRALQEEAARRAAADGDDAAAPAPAADAAAAPDEAPAAVNDKA